MTTLITSAIAAGLPFAYAAVSDDTSSPSISAAVDRPLDAHAASSRLRLSANTPVADHSSEGAGGEAAAAAADSSTPATDCAVAAAGSMHSAPAQSFDGGAIVGTSSADLAQFADAFNAIRVEHCLEPVPLNNFRFDSCMEQRLVWMAEDPSTDPASAWGHQGSVRSDGAPSVGCDGNLAGGSDNDSATVAQKWWDSPAHRASLYRPDIPVVTDDVCVTFAMTHGGVPNEPLAFARASARWTHCSEVEAR